jgi:transposase
MISSEPTGIRSICIPIPTSRCSGFLRKTGNHSSKLWKIIIGIRTSIKVNQLPRFKNPCSKKNQVIFTNYAIRTKGNVLKLSLARAMQTKFSVKSLNLELPPAVQERLNMDEVQQVKVTWDNSSKKWYFLIIYKQEEQEIDASFTNVMAIDLGLTNLCGICFKDSKEQILVSGKTLKSRNAYLTRKSPV